VGDAVSNGADPAYYQILSRDDGEDVEIALVTGDYDATRDRCRIPARSVDANAALIAAAPDLLAALVGLFEHCALIHKHW